MMGRLRQLWTALCIYLKELNFYTADSTDDHELSNGRISTRIYVVSLLLFLSTLSIYTLATYETRTIDIKKPSLLDYEQLIRKIGWQQLSCPCDQTAIDYGLIGEFKPIFHPICSSIFTDEAWFDFLKSSPFILSPYEFWYTAFYQFQMIAELCQTAQNAVDDDMRQFSKGKWIANTMIPKDTIQAGIKQIIEDRISIIVSTFHRSLNLARLGPNYQPTSLVATGALQLGYYKVTELTSKTETPDNYQYCICSSEPFCKAHVVVIIVPTDIAYIPEPFIIPNLLTGCNFINTLMASSFDCFFNQSCLSIIQQTRNSTIQLNALRSSPQFPPNTTLQIIVDKMMIESWEETFNYSSFYEACHPDSCSYTVNVRKDVFTLVAIIIGVFGGLNAGLNLIVPRMVRFARGNGKDLYNRLRLQLTRHRAVSQLGAST